MNPAEAKHFLDSLARFGMRFGLERTHAVLDGLGHPERRFRVLHVAGTNGKGSTCAFAASILRAAGLRVGLYTSPHLVRVNERIQVDGQEIPDARLAEGVEAILRVFPGAGSGEDPLTFFEFGTALALWYFAERQVDVAVLETGLGGRLDATNAVPANVSVVTRVALDHTAVLGATLPAIAGEKAGIFKPGATVVLARQEPPALEVLSSSARSVGQAPRVAGADFAFEGEGPFTFRSPSRAIGLLRPSLLGPHQRENAEAAVAAALALEPGLSDSAVREGLASTVWPGRLEAIRRDPLVLLDGAHNPNGAQTLARAMGALHPGARTHLVFGVLADKDVRGIAEALVPLASEVHLLTPRSERALPAEELARLCTELGARPRLHASLAEALDAALAEAGKDPRRSLVLVAGSLYVVGEARGLLAAPVRSPNPA